MNTIAKKLLIPAIIGGLFVFAVNLGVCDMSNASANMVEYVETVPPTSKLDSQEFWNKFRESIMKDRPENNQDDPPQTVENDPSDDSSEAERHSVS